MCIRYFAGQKGDISRLRMIFPCQCKYIKKWKILKYHLWYSAFLERGGDTIGMILKGLSISRFSYISLLKHIPKALVSFLDLFPSYSTFFVGKSPLIKLIKNNLEVNFPGWNSCPPLRQYCSLFLLWRKAKSLKSVCLKGVQ